MNRAAPLRTDGIAALRRLAALTELDGASMALLETAKSRPAKLAAKRELLTESRRVPAPLLILDGWAARTKIVQEGRRQLISFVLPGDLVGNCGFTSAMATSTVMTLTDVTFCHVPDEVTPQLDRAYAISRAFDEAYLIGQIVRLGRMDAAERLIDLLLETNERLAYAGLSENGRFDLPLTQEVLADALGLTAVHVNRMLQQARKRGDLTWSSGSVRLNDPEALRQSIGRDVIRVA